MAGTTPVLKKGAKGEAVRRLQEGLQQLGYDPGAIDGILGTSTGKAIKAFQSDSGRTADGVVGPNTWTALEEAWKLQYANAQGC